MTRHQCNMASFVIFLTDDKVCLGRRQGTNHMCGKMGLPAGHVEEGESYKQAAIREMREELGVALDLDDLEFGVMSHSPDDNYVNVYFICKKWSGELRIHEPNKCSELSWYDLNELPNDMVPYNKKILENLDLKYQEIKKH